MTIEIYTLACEILEEGGYYAEVRENYSGRGMFGKTVPAIVTEAPPVLLGTAIAAALNHDDAEVDVLDRLDVYPRRMDNMGLSRVYY